MSLRPSVMLFSPFSSVDSTGCIDFHIAVSVISDGYRKVDYVSIIIVRVEAVITNPYIFVAKQSTMLQAIQILVV